MNQQAHMLELHNQGQVARGGKGRLGTRNRWSHAERSHRLTGKIKRLAGWLLLLLIGRTL